jgi:hypothetical protein
VRRKRLGCWHCHGGIAFGENRRTRQVRQNDTIVVARYNFLTESSASRTRWTSAPLQVRIRFTNAILGPKGTAPFFFLSSQLADRFHKDRELEWGQLGCQCTISPTSERWRSSETHSNEIINDKHKREHNEKEKNENENEKTRARAQISY